MQERTLLTTEEAATYMGIKKSYHTTFCKGFLRRIIGMA